MSRNAPDPPDKVVWPSERIAPFTGRDIDGSAEPEQLPVFAWRKAAMSGIVLTVVSGVAIWAAASGTSGPATTLTRATPAPAGTSWEAVLPPPDPALPSSGAVPPPRTRRPRRTPRS
nr:hypothetical protein GCM10020093_074410 [Planobispora longispora]